MILKNISQSMFGRIATVIFQAIFTVISARFLTPAEFGIYAQIIIIQSIAFILIECGLEQAIIQAKEIKHQDLQFSLLFITGLGMIFLAVSDAIIYYHHNTINIYYYTYLTASFMFLAYPIGLVSQANLIKQKKFKDIAIIETGSYLVSYLIVGTTLFFLNFGIISIVIALLADTSIRSFFYIINDKDKKYLLSKPRVNKNLLIFGIKFSIIRIVNQFTLKGGQMILASLANKTELGLYNRAETLSQIPVSVLGQTLSVVLLSEISNDQDQTKQKLIIVESIALTLSLLIPCTALVIIHAEILVTILFGTKWLDMVIIFQILIASLPFRVLYKIMESNLTANGLLRYFFKIQLAYAFLSISLMLIGYTGLGIKGVALGTTISAVFYSTYITYNAYKSISRTKKPEFKKIDQPTLISLLSLSVLLDSNIPFFMDKTANIASTLFWLFLFISIQIAYHAKYLKKQH